MIDFKSIRKFCLLFMGVFALVWMANSVNNSRNAKLVSLYSSASQLPSHYMFNQDGKMVWEAWGNPVIIETSKEAPAGLFIRDTKEQLSLLGMILWAIVFALMFRVTYLMVNWQIIEKKEYHASCSVR